MIKIQPEIFHVLVLVWIGIAIVLLPVLLRVTAPYGRHSKTNWGPMIPNRLGWFIMELPALAVFLYFILTGNSLESSVIVVVTVLWSIHYTHRALIFPMRLKSGRKKMPVLIMLFAVFFNIVNGFLNGYWFGHLSPEYAESWLMDPRFITGILLFAAGFVINQYHDQKLLSLRKSSDQGYQVPKGALFRYVSCPNFLGEIIEWGGFALLTWCMPSLSFFIWTFVNLVPRALDHHRWYRSHFKDYPPNRKAIIPFLL